MRINGTAGGFRPAHVNPVLGPKPSDKSLSVPKGDDHKAMSPTPRPKDPGPKKVDVPKR